MKKGVYSARYHSLTTFKIVLYVSMGMSCVAFISYSVYGNLGGSLSVIFFCFTAFTIYVQFQVTKMIDLLFDLKHDKADKNLDQASESRMFNK